MSSDFRFLLQKHFGQFTFVPFLRCLPALTLALAGRLEAELKTHVTGFQAPWWLDEQVRQRSDEGMVYWVMKDWLRDARQLSLAVPPDVACSAWSSHGVCCNIGPRRCQMMQSALGKRWKKALSMREPPAKVARRLIPLLQVLMFAISRRCLLVCSGTGPPQRRRWGWYQRQEAKLSCGRSQGSSREEGETERRWGCRRWQSDSCRVC